MRSDINEKRSKKRDEFQKNIDKSTYNRELGEIISEGGLYLLDCAPVLPVIFTPPNVRDKSQDETEDEAPTSDQNQGRKQNILATVYNMNRK